MIEVKVPDIGDFDEVEVIEVMVAAGDTIAVDDSLITVESDKASMEIPSSHAGLVKDIKINIGDMVSEGSVILTIDAAEVHEQTAKEVSALMSATRPPKPEPEPEPVLEKVEPPKPIEPKPSPTKHINSEAFIKSHASPSVRKFARELGADLSKVKGSGRNGRITKEDVKSYIKQRLSRPDPVSSGAALGVEPMPEIDFSQWGEVENLKLNNINKLTGKIMHRNWVNIPHVTQFDEADISDLEEFRKKANVDYADQGFKLTMVAFLLKAVSLGLKKFPRFNTSLSIDGHELIQKKYCHIGVAVATADGLVVPIVRDVDKKSLGELAKDVSEAAKKARDKKLSPGDMQGGCFTISSLGGIGGTKFTPIINAPEVAILGVSKAKMSPLWNGQEFEPRLMCPLSLSYDHRVIDGAEGAAFTSYLSRILSDIRELLI
ncbi:MAG: dihydrolipoyllysine-residue acetyltransferase [Gammaproteobacteria bacterium]|nr:dihydrolipoyllysine-residue acetyltransferase [Gammaproteobacteria bacterium]